MIINQFKKLASGLFASITLLSLNAHALIVFDPSNFSRTTVTAVQAVEAQVIRLNQLKLQIQDNLRNFAGVDIARLQEEQRKIKSVYESAKRMQTSITGVKNDFEGVKAVFGSGNYQSFDQFVNDIKRRADAGDAVAKNMFLNSQNAQQTIKTAFEQHEILVDKASSVNGVTEAAQSTTAAVGILIQQQNSMLAMMSADQMRKSVESTESNQKLKDSSEKRNAYITRAMEEQKKIEQESKKWSK